VKKQLLILLLVLPWMGFGQPLRRVEQYNLDSVAKSNVAKIVYPQTHDGMLSYNPFWRFKITASVQLNSNIFSEELTTEDWLSFGAYDIRARFYITPNFKIFQKTFITGNNIFYTTGIVTKF